jgi:hypothetical protein
MKELVENWGEVKSALLHGLSAQKQAIVAPLLENQKAQMLSETASAGSVDTSAIAGFRKIMLPMIRRVIPNSIGTELVGVQPMTGPVGLIYSMRYTYNEAVTAQAAASTALTFDAVTGKYVSGGMDGGVANINPVTDPEAFGNYNMIRRFYSGATSTGAQAAGASGFAQGTIANITGDATGAGWGSALDASTVALNGAGGSLYGGGGSFLEGSGGRKMGLQVVSQAVEAKSRKLQASWTVEAMQDLQNQHGLDIENELTSVLSQEITQEIDNEIITDLLSLAGTVSTFDGSVPAAAGYYKPTFVGDRLANLGVQINFVANEIARKTRKGAGNFIVVSPMIVSVLQTAAKSVFAPAVEGSFQGPNNTKLVGTLNGSIKVYSYLYNSALPTDIYNTTNTPTQGFGTGNDLILVGYKGGNGETDTGYFYCPYIPLMSSGTIMNPVTTQPVISLMTRYGKGILNDRTTSLGNSADYYGKIAVKSLSLL